MYYNCTRETHKLLNPPLLNPPLWTPDTLASDCFADQEDSDLSVGNRMYACMHVCTYVKYVRTYVLGICAYPLLRGASTLSLSRILVSIMRLSKRCLSTASFRARAATSFSTRSFHYHDPAPGRTLSLRGAATVRSAQAGPVLSGPSLLDLNTCLYVSSLVQRKHGFW